MTTWFNTRECAAYTGRHHKTVLHAVQEYQRTGRSGLEGYQATSRGRWSISQDAADRWVRGEKPTSKRVLRAV